MTFFDWLASPVGLDFGHAVIVLLLAMAGWFSYQSKQRADANAKLLNGHLVEHVALAAKLDEDPTPPAAAGAKPQVRSVAPPTER